MRRAGVRGRLACAALQCLSVALRVALVAPASQAQPRNAVNWASGAAYGATAVASNSGHWVRPCCASVHA